MNRVFALTIVCVLECKENIMKGRIDCVSDNLSDQLALLS